MPEGRSKVPELCGMDLSLEGKGGKACTIDAYGRKISEGRLKLRKWLNKQMKIEMSDGRILVGIFLCTDRDGNVILGSCTEYINPDAWGFADEPRMLGLVMVPGKHIVSVKHDAETSAQDNQRSAVAEGLITSDDRSSTLSNELRTDPIECSQNPLWDPNLSDSPDSEGAKAVADDQPSMTNQTQENNGLISSPSKITHDPTPLQNLYT